MVKRSSWPYYTLYLLYNILLSNIALLCVKIILCAIWVPHILTTRKSDPYDYRIKRSRRKFPLYVCESYLPWSIWSAHTPRGWLGRELVGRYTTTQNMILFMRSRFSVSIHFFASRIITHRSTVIITTITIIWLHEYISASADHLENETLTVCSFVRLKTKYCILLFSSIIHTYS